MSVHGLIPGVEEYLGADLLRRRGQHVEVVEGALVPEAADVAVTDDLLVALHPPHDHLPLLSVPVPPRRPLIVHFGFLSRISTSNIIHPPISDMT